MILEFYAAFQKLNNNKSRASCQEPSGTEGESWGCRTVPPGTQQAPNPCGLQAATGHDVIHVPLQHTPGTVLR